MLNEETINYVCPDCAAHYSPRVRHVCLSAGQRLASELLDRVILSGKVDEAEGLLWLYRVAFRVRLHLNGLRKYEDRARMARHACELIERRRGV